MSDDEVCDESKCRSAGPLELVNSNKSTRYDCYVSDTEQTKYCDDGYVGKLVKDEEEHNFGLYYTCCPKGYSGTPRRHCSDPVKLNARASPSQDTDENNRSEMECDINSTRRYPRRMKTSKYDEELFICCDFPINEASNENLHNDENDFLWLEESPQDLDNTSGLVIITDGNSSIRYSDNSMCDESKCIGQYFGSNSSYFCLGGGPGTLYPFRCSDGYVGRLVNTMEYPIQGALFRDNRFFYTSSSVTLHHYTCCPPDLPLETPVYRHCSYPFRDQSEQDVNPSVQDCSTLTRSLPFRREIARRYYGEGNDEYNKFFLCCDSQIAPEALSANFHEEASCSPVCSYLDLQQCTHSNSYAFFLPMSCKEKYPFPHPVYTEKDMEMNLNLGGTLHADMTLWECCKERYHGPFIRDKWFNLTLWPQVILSTLALLASGSLVIAVVACVWREKKHGGGDPSSSVNPRRRRIDPRRNRRQIHASSSRNSHFVNAYNLYLVILAVPEITLNAFVLGMYLTYLCQYYSIRMPGYLVVSFDPKLNIIPLDSAVIISSSTANLYLNIIVAHEVFILLKNSSKAIHTNPPSLRRVGIQAFCVLVFSIGIFIFHFFTDGRVSNKVLAPISFMLSAGLPILYLFYICFTIWKNRLLPPTLVGRTRELALYFCRIICVFFLFWLPAMSLIVQAGWIRTRDVLNYEDARRSSTKRTNEYAYAVALLFCACQSIFSTIMAMTKSDVRKAVFDLYRPCLKKPVSTTEGVVPNDEESSNPQPKGGLAAETTQEVLSQGENGTTTKLGRES